MKNRNSFAGKRTAKLKHFAVILKIKNISMNGCAIDLFKIKYFVFLRVF